MNRGQSKVGFGVTGWGSGWRVKVPDRYTQGQVGEREVAITGTEYTPGGGRNNGI